MSKPRLSPRQRDVLVTIHDCCRPVRFGIGDEKTVIPANMFQLGMTFACEFFYEREFERFIQNLERRGFVRIENRQFIYITDAGKAAVEEPRHD